MDRKSKSKIAEVTPAEAAPGIERRTLAYNAETMLCHFTMKKGGKIPPHSHPAVQTGFVIKGKVKFSIEGGDDFIAEAGTGYVFDSEQSHGAEVLEDSELIECFAPMRPEYA